MKLRDPKIHDLRQQYIVISGSVDDALSRACHDLLYWQEMAAKLEEERSSGYARVQLRLNLLPKPVNGRI
jgi:hypothetical protein